MHSAAFCGYELEEVKAQLANYRVKDSLADLVCKLCYKNHLRDAAQGLIANAAAAVACDDGAEYASSAPVAADSGSGMAGAASKANAVTVGGAAAVAVGGVGAAAVIVSTKTNKKKKQSNISGKKRAPPAAASKTTAKKTRKKRKDFTLQEKISILDELECHGVTMKALCDKHGTNRTSVGKWKALRPEMEKQIKD